MTLERLQAPGLYVSSDAAREAFAHQGMFNVVGPEAGWKADLIMRKHRPFSEAEFPRREATDFFGVPLAIASLEDVISSKLVSARLGDSRRQLDDVRTLLRLVGDGVGRSYVEDWVDALDVRAEWGQSKGSHLASRYQRGAHRAGERQFVPSGAR